jgi:phosphoglycolate phosphatase-like HAD superfamily hydrolase
MPGTSDLQKQLKELQPAKDFFVGIDSDGCVFDTMELKHKECFCPNYIKYFGLQKVSRYAREVWDFVNLYSKGRGTNRFPALINSVELLATRPEVKQWNVTLPDFTPLKTWMENESKLGNSSLQAYAEQANDPLIKRVLDWSLRVNADIEEMVTGMEPFPNAIDALKAIHQKADAVVISQTPVEALTREWEESSIDAFIRTIAGQEHGTKTEHIALAAKGKYAAEKTLMIGDAPGDLKAAKNNGALFFPINPGHENESWKRLVEEGLNRFFTLNFAGSYEQSLIEEFKAYLPEKPNWKS